MLKGPATIPRIISETLSDKASKREFLAHRTTMSPNNTKVSLGQFNRTKTNKDFIKTAPATTQAQTLTPRAAK